MGNTIKGFKYFKTKIMTDVNMRENNTSNIHFVNTNTNTFVFTRYLYEKDEVKIALLLAILNKNETACFWCAELFYSGFANELKTYIWQIYYDFYASLNPKYEAYLLKKLKNEYTVNDILSIINDLLIRPFNCDVFLLRHIVLCHDSLSSSEKNNNENKTKYENKIKKSPPCSVKFKNTKELFIKMLENNEYISISEYLFVFIGDNNINNDELDDIFVALTSYFLDIGVKINKTNAFKDWIKIKKYIAKTHIIDDKIVLLSRIMQYFNSLNKILPGKNVYVILEDEEISQYKNVIINKQCVPSDQEINVTLPAYRILPSVCKYNIDEDKSLNLFELKRNTNNICNAYRHNWLYYASFSSIWQDRIIKHGGKIDHINKDVYIPEDELGETFYALYNYEPDEQKKEIQNRCIADISKDNSWGCFYEKYKGKCILYVDETILSKLDTIKYV